MRDAKRMSQGGDLPEGGLPGGDQQRAAGRPCDRGDGELLKGATPSAGPDLTPGPQRRAHSGAHLGQGVGGVGQQGIESDRQQRRVAHE